MFSKKEISDTAAILTLIDMAGLTPAFADKAVNGTEDDDMLGWYDEGDNDRAIVCAAFHVLGQELLAHCDPVAVLMIVNELVDLRNATMIAMKELPK